MCSAMLGLRAAGGDAVTRAYISWCQFASARPSHKPSLEVSVPSQKIKRDFREHLKLKNRKSTGNILNAQLELTVLPFLKHYRINYSLFLKLLFVIF